MIAGGGEGGEELSGRVESKEGRVFLVERRGGSSRREINSHIWQPWLRGQG